MLCPHLHVPLQAGDDGVLRRMRRRYDAALARERLAMIRELLPDAAIGTDVIAGFPGEDDAAFERTLALRRGEPAHVPARLPVLGADAARPRRSSTASVPPAVIARARPAAARRSASGKRAAFARALRRRARPRCWSRRRATRRPAGCAATPATTCAPASTGPTPGRGAASPVRLASAPAAGCARGGGRRMTPEARAGARGGPRAPLRRGPSTCALALTHRSVRPTRANNEKLEFLGDAVLALAMSDLLMARFPEAREGELSKIRASLVNAEVLARKARALDLGRWLRLGKGEEKSGGREKASILAAGYEAVLGAVYLDARLRGGARASSSAHFAADVAEHPTRRARATTRRSSRS